MEEIRRRKSAAELKSILSGIRELLGEPISNAEIKSEINHVRAMRRESENGLIKVQRML